MTTDLPQNEHPQTIHSTDDARVENSPVRHQYRVLTDEEKNEVANIKDIGLLFISAVKKRQSREAELAVTKMEEAVMWAVKGITA